MSAMTGVAQPGYRGGADGSRVVLGFSTVAMAGYIEVSAAIVGEHVQRNCTTFLHWYSGGIRGGLNIQSPSLSPSQLLPYADR